MDTTKALQDRIAADLMSHEVVLLLETMPLREAASLLLKNQIGGAPVVDSRGKCVGVLSTVDFLRLAVKRTDATRPTAPTLPLTCPFLAKHQTKNSREIFLCTLPPGVCSIQTKQKEPGDEELLICDQPHCVLADWANRGGGEVSGG